MRPNVLFIMADQFRVDAVGCVGSYARTPNLDKLAAKGWLFTGAFPNSAECVPSRITLAVGLYPHQTGVDQNILCTRVEAILAEISLAVFVADRHMGALEGSLSFLPRRVLVATDAAARARMALAEAGLGAELSDG